MAGNSLNDNLEKYFELVVKAWDDNELRRQLKRNPVETLRCHGVYVPPDTTVKIRSNSEKVVWNFKKRELILPFIERPEGLTDFGADGAGPQSVDCFSKIDCFSALGV